MSQPVILKVYGSLWPTAKAVAGELRRIALAAYPASDDIVCLDKDLLRISFEGIYFPVDDILQAIKCQLDCTQKGRLDVLDLEKWILTRYTFAKGKIKASSAPLNNVLDYSGH